jgi:purine-binding chemotaxis protein CheW
MSDAPQSTNRADLMRRAFDAAFALPPAVDDRTSVSVLTLRVGGEPLAFRLADIAAIVSDRAIVPVPSTAAGLLGLAGIRGDIVPVFSLASILGLPTPDAPPTWMVLTVGAEPVALAFDTFEEYLVLPAGALRQADGDGARSQRQFIRQVVQLDNEVRPVVAIPRVVESIRSRTPSSGEPRE